MNASERPLHSRSLAFTVVFSQYQVHCHLLLFTRASTHFAQCRSKMSSRREVRSVWEEEEEEDEQEVKNLSLHERFSKIPPPPKNPRQPLKTGFVRAEVCVYV